MLNLTSIIIDFPIQLNTHNSLFQSPHSGNWYKFVLPPTVNSLASKLFVIRAHMAPLLNYPSDVPPDKIKLCFSLFNGRILTETVQLIMIEKSPTLQ